MGKSEIQWNFGLPILGQHFPGIHNFKWIQVHVSRKKKEIWCHQMVFGNHYLKWADIGFAIELVSYMVIKKMYWQELSSFIGSHRKYLLPTCLKCYIHLIELRICCKSFIQCLSALNDVSWMDIHFLQAFIYLFSFYIGNQPGF